MVRVFLVDDEYLEIEGLRRLIDWGKFGMEVVGVAYDGLSAREKILNLHPDVVFTDIRMPGIGGFELIAGVKPFLPETLFVVISGYNDFAYIRMALRLGLADYLDKPVTVEKIEEVLRRIEEVFSARNTRLPPGGEDAASLRMAFETLIPQAEIAIPDLRDLERRMGINLLGIKNLYVCAIDEQEGQTSLDCAQAEIDAILRNGDLEMVLCASDSQRLAIAYASEVDGNGFRALKALLQRCVDEGWIRHAGISGANASLLSLNKAVEEARCALLYAIFFDEDFVLFEKVENSSQVYSGRQNSIGRIGFALRTGAWDDAFSQVRSEVEAIKAERLSPDLFCHACLRLIYLGLSVCGETGHAFSPNHAFMPHIEIALLSNGEEIGEWVLSTYARMVEWMKALRTTAARKSVLRAKEYIDEHYAEPITLDSLSAMCDMHPTYFSVLFKEQVGIPYSKYLNEVRMEQAKRLLHVGEKVKNVCEKVGFINCRYFVNKFKNYTGYTPDQFRRIP